MDEEIKKMLTEEIKKQISGLSALAPGSKEKEAAIDDLATLYKLRLEESKNDLDWIEKHEARVEEGELKKKQLSEQTEARLAEEQQKNKLLSNQNVDRYLNFGLGVAGIVVPLIFYGAWYWSGLKFEETGTFTSFTLRNLINNFKPTKR
jgi:hypothetical protein